MNKTEKLCKDQLIKEGYLVENAVKTQWHRNDLFNLWDFIAINQTEVRFIQVSTLYLSEGSHAGKDFIGFPCPDNCKKEFWRWDKKKKEFVIYDILNEGGDKRMAKRSEKSTTSHMHVVGRDKGYPAKKGKGKGTASALPSHRGKSEGVGPGSRTLGNKA